MFCIIRLTSILLLVHCGLPAQQILSGDSWSTAQKNKQATIILTYIETPRCIFKNSNNQLEGIAIDIFRAFVNYVQREKGVKIKVNLQKKTEDFNVFLNTIKNSARGGVFGLGPVTITEERKQYLTFTPPYLRNRSVLITHNSVPNLNNLTNIGSEFKGMKAYVIRNSTQEAEILEIKKKYFPDLPIVYVNSPDDLINRPLQDPKSFTKTDFIYYADALKNKKPILRHPSAESATGSLGFIMPKDSDWAIVWNEFLNDKNGFTSTIEYRRVLERHLGIREASIILDNQ